MIEIGQINELFVHEKFGGGYKLRAIDFDVDVILPSSEVVDELKIGEKLEVFVYVDNQDQAVASLTKPSALVDEFAVMSIKETHQFGAFADWGISKDLLIPDTEQKELLGANKHYIVRVCLDERTQKVYGTTKVGKYIQGSVFDIKEGDQVTITPASYEELGYRCLINKKFIGMIYHNEIFQKVYVGVPINGFVKKLRDDGLVDAALQVQGIRNLMESQDFIIDFLHKNAGRSHLYDKSSPEEIRSLLNMSKKTFKSAIGMLYKQKKITITKNGIKLRQDDEL